VGPRFERVNYVGYGDHDSNTAAADAHVVCDWSSYAGLASVQVYDDTPDPSSGQIVYYSFNYAAAGAGRTDLLENTVVYLTAQESTPTGGIAGTAMLEGMADHSEIKVTAYPGGSHAYTDAAGHYAIEALYAGNYTVEATKDEWSDEDVEGVAVGEGQQTTGVDMMLHPITMAELCESPNLSIPDSSPAGVYDTMTLTDEFEITEVEIYVNIPHTYVGDLIVEITSPEGTTVRLHNRTGGSANDLIGWYDSELGVDGPGSLVDFADESTVGEWELWVSDNAGADVGTVVDWCVQAMGAAPTGVDEGEHELIPAEYVLSGVRPNPFNPVTTVTYGVPAESRVSLKVYNVAGREVRVLVDDRIEAGYHTVTWDGRDDRGNEVSSGVYFCRMEAEGHEASAKMVLLK